MSTAYPELMPAPPSCLIMVDVQRQFILPQTEAILPGILSILDRFETIVATRLQALENGPIHRFKQWLPAPWDSPGSQLALDLSARDPDKTRVFDKSFFSAFTPEVREWLAPLGLTEIHLCGMDSDMCVMRTATDIMECGYRPVLLWDLCASTGGASRHEHTLIQYKRLIGKNQVLRYASKPAHGAAS